MTSRTVPEQGEPGDETAQLSLVADALGSIRRRAILSVLISRDEPVDLDRLVDATWQRETGAEGDALDDAERDRVRTSLYHVHLPKLSELGIVQYDRANGVVASAEHPLFECEQIRTLLADNRALREESVDALCSILGRPRERAVVTALVAADVPLTRQSLAQRVAVPERTADAPKAIADGGRRRSVDVTTEIYQVLHHVHLPRLDALGVIEYDPDAGLVRFDGDERLFDSVLARTADADDADASRSADADSWFGRARVGECRRLTARRDPVGTVFSGAERDVAMGTRFPDASRSAVAT